jgi:hypothetical protein
MQLPIASLVAFVRSLGLALAAACSASAASANSWLDIEGRIQYGYYTEDARALANLGETLASQNSDDGMGSYYAALANYRLALIWADEKKDQARAACERCISALDRALDANREFVEALALQSACLGTLAALSSWRAPLAGQKSQSQAQKAFKLAPRNPRVLLVEAINDYERSGAGKNRENRERALGKLQDAVAAFEKERQQTQQIPGWGAAEAYAWLGRGYLERGDVVAARDALERALLIAPEFLFARRLMSRITDG